MLGLDPLLENEWKSFMRIVRFLLFLLITPLSFSKDKPLVYAPEIPKPTLSEIRYGKHERNILDFWKAESTKPTPLVFVIHGGGGKADPRKD